MARTAAGTYATPLAPLGAPPNRLMPISYFRVKNSKKPFLRVELFFLKIGQDGCKKNLECYADFRSEKLSRKHARKKVRPKHFLWGLRVLEKSFSGFFGGKFFSE
jgi:hypothetical protein